jgi:hypothetical protein
VARKAAPPRVGFYDFFQARDNLWNVGLKRGVDQLDDSGEAELACEKTGDGFFVGGV